MGKPEQLPLTVHELQSYSHAAKLALRMRRKTGNDTAYDHFLCDYIGETGTDGDNFRHIARTALSGVTYRYNNPHTIHRSFTREGTLINVRRAQGTVLPQDLAHTIFVATADLRTSITTEWQVADIARTGWGKRSVVTLEAPERLRLVTEGDPSAIEDPLEASLSEGNARVLSQLVFEETGMYFTPLVGPTESLHGISELVSEVNQLTLRDGIDLDARRAAAGHRLASVTPLLLKVA